MQFEGESPQGYRNSSLVFEDNEDMVVVVDDDEMDGMEGAGRQRSNSAPTAHDPTIYGLGSRPETRTGTFKGAKKKGSRTIGVICRFRPENADENAKGGRPVVTCGKDGLTVNCLIEDRPIPETYVFHYSKVFPSYATQSDVFSYVGEPLLDNYFSGVNCSVIAYGQTGSGKTYTMMGVLNERTGAVVSHQGLIPQAFSGIFARLSALEDTTECEFSIYFIELYMERVLDLLQGKNTNVVGGREVLEQEGEKKDVRMAPDGSVYVTNTCTAHVVTMADAMDVVQTGLMRRQTAATKANKVSSRSHAILVCTLTTKDRETKHIRSSQLYMVDLAGSEKVAKTESDGLRLEESKMINTSLFALGQVIVALASKAFGKKGSSTMHVPFRDSKLTRLLENSLGGNALTYVILTCSPSSYNSQETLSTLRFGSKAQMITTTPQKNITRTVEEMEMLLEKAHRDVEEQKAMVRMLQNQIKSQRLSAVNVVHGGSTTTGGTPTTTTTSVNRWFRPHAQLERLQDIIASSALCPISNRKMRDPVVALDGYTYDKFNITNYMIQNDMRSPITNERINAMMLVPNLLFKSLLQLCTSEGFDISPEGFSFKPTSPFLVFELASYIVDFLEPETILGYARANRMFARAIYDRDRWIPGINQFLEDLPDDAPMRVKVRNSTLPAHKLYLIMRDGGDVDHKISKSVFTTSTVKLFSTSLPRSKN